MSKFEEFESEKKIFGCACNILVMFNKKVFCSPVKKLRYNVYAASITV